jgi:hypothetical protein
MNQFSIGSYWLQEMPCVLVVLLFHCMSLICIGLYRSGTSSVSEVEHMSPELSIRDRVAVADFETSAALNVHLTHTLPRSPIIPRLSLGELASPAMAGSSAAPALVAAAAAAAAAADAAADAAAERHSEVDAGAVHTSPQALDAMAWRQRLAALRPHLSGDINAATFMLQQTPPQSQSAPALASPSVTPRGRPGISPRVGGRGSALSTPRGAPDSVDSGAETADELTSRLDEANARVASMLRMTRAAASQLPPADAEQYEKKLAQVRRDRPAGQHAARTNRGWVMQASEEYMQYQSEVAQLKEVLSLQLLDAHDEITTLRGANAALEAALANLEACLVLSCVVVRFLTMPTEPAGARAAGRRAVGPGCRIRPQPAAGGLRCGLP